MDKPTATLTRVERCMPLLKVDIPSMLEVVFESPDAIRSGGLPTGVTAPERTCQ